MLSVLLRYLDPMLRTAAGASSWQVRRQQEGLCLLIDILQFACIVAMQRVLQAGAGRSDSRAAQAWLTLIPSCV